MTKSSLAIMFICLTAMPFFAIPSFAVAEVCKMSALNEFQAKQGSITLDFSMHRAPDDLAVFEAIMDKAEPFTPQMIEPFYRWLRKRSEFMRLPEQLQKANQLSELAKMQKIAWVGIEYSPSEVGDKDAKGRDGVTRFNALKQALKDATLSPEMVELALLMFARSPARFVWFSDPVVRQKVRLVPLDSDTIKAVGQKILIDNITMTDTLDSTLKYFGATDDQRNALFVKINQVTQSNDDGAIPALMAELNKFGDLIQFIRIVFNNEKSLNEYMTRLISTKRAFNRNQRDRDTYAANIALSQSGNGWISFGPDHAENLKTQLESICGR